MSRFSFKRVTSSGNYIPEIDGLRFVAITFVVIMHILRRIYAECPPVNTTKITILDNGILSSFYKHGGIGVELFFVISGLILGMPFAFRYHKNPKASYPLRNYFIRRLTRLEPPYIIALVVFTLILLISHSQPLSVVGPRFLASLTYTSWLFFPQDKLPLINGVFWSLEVEVLFYISAPFLAKIFKLPRFTSRTILIISIFCFITIDLLFNLRFFPLLQYIQYFLIGFLLCDFFVTYKGVNLKSKWVALISYFMTVGILSVLLAFDFTEGYLMYIFPFLACCLYGMALFVHSIRQLFSFKFVPIIGGMCYSIYLIHTYIIAVSSKLSFQIFKGDTLLGIIINICILIGLTLIISSVYFLVIEKPCMRHDWYIAFVPRKLRDKYFKSPVE